MLSQFSVTSYQPDRSAASGGRSNKRARLVCFRCHEKKIKCDLSSQVRDGEDARRCSNCVDAGSQCRLRSSRRGTVRRPTGTSDRVPDRVSDRRLCDNEIVNETSGTAIPLAPLQPESNNAVSDEIQITQLGNEPELEIPQVIVSPGPAIVGVAVADAATSVSPRDSRPRPSYIGDTGYMQIFSDEGAIATQQHAVQQQPVDCIAPGLQESHLDVYFESARVWCPILDQETFNSDPELHDSPLLRHALALCGNEIKPPLLQHTSSLAHYTRAKELFYGNHEPNPLVRILALMLFYWWSAEPPNVVSLDTTWWWTGTAIRLAQQIGLHQEPLPGSQLQASESIGLRRRIWWTLVARERITALSQGRPCLIDLDDCDVPMPTIHDFPASQNDIRAQLFVHWVPLCELIGRIGKMLRRRRPSPVDTNPCAIQLARELMAWVQSLPSSLQPGIKGERTIGFHRDVHGLHLTYLSSITLLHLNREAQPLPKASIAAIVAASCTARIFHDYLLRGSVSFLAGQAGWYITIAVLALLHARRLDGLASAADADIEILRAALAAMAPRWHSARMFQMGIDKLMDSQSLEITQQAVVAVEMPVSPSMDELSALEGIKWQDYFPYISEETSPLLGSLLSNSEQALRFPELGWTCDFPSQLGLFFSQPEDFDASFFTL